LENGQVFFGIKADLPERGSEIEVSRRSEPSDGGGFAFELGGGFNFRTGDQIDRIGIDGQASKTTSPPSMRAATTDSAPAPENCSWPLMMPIVISAPPRICTGSTFSRF
jgi:hypothetical protein